MNEPLTTCWSKIYRGRDPEDSQYEDAWRFLYRTYSGLIGSYFARHAPDEVTASEWTDEFIACWVEGSLDKATPVKGRFRQYLFTALRHFRFRQLKQHRKRSAVDLEALAEPAAPEERAAYEGEYARSVLGKALESLASHQRQEGNRYHDLITRYYFGDPTPSYAELASALELTVKAVERQLARARAQLRSGILAQLEETVSTREELEEEVQWLLAHCPEVLVADLGSEEAT